MIRLVRLRQLRVQTGVLDLQPPHNEAGTPCYRGAAGVTSHAARLCLLHCMLFILVDHGLWPRLSSQESVQCFVVNTDNDILLGAGQMLTWINRLTV